MSNMMQALKDRLGLTAEAVKQTRIVLEEKYGQYPEGIDKIQLNPDDPFESQANVHLDEPFDWKVMEDVAEDMGLRSEIGDDDHWFGFYDTIEDDDGDVIMETLAGSVRNDRPIPITPGPSDSTEKFRLEVLLRYLTKRYGNGSTPD